MNALPHIQLALGLLAMLEAGLLFLVVDRDSWPVAVAVVIEAALLHWS